MESDRPSIELPPEIHQQCASRIEGTEFESVDEYVTFVLEVLFEQEDDSRTVEQHANDEAMKERLESLGYM
ncbi:CopG family transcriptional regulator [Halorussus pelagicus]|uniref:CopG family transcriptional regulator n=1 Tax=Halorussus pelagicus TaxID=2505977 RepID=UPI000FFBCEEC|nr:CopG family transcriptional regulator [Halorussus pelagicus]